jgi:enoyl-CoA hydratase/carnithine racemase
MADFEVLYDELYSRPDVKAAVLISGKPTGFIAGADITMLAACKTAEEVHLRCPFLRRFGEPLFICYA